nr:MAG TPA: hypothetical protein [Caudoviricetes sp.]
MIYYLYNGGKEGVSQKKKCIHTIKSFLSPLPGGFLRQTETWTSILLCRQ